MDTCKPPLANAKAFCELPCSINCFLDNNRGWHYTETNLGAYRFSLPTSLCECGLTYCLGRRLCPQPGGHLGLLQPGWILENRRRLRRVLGFGGWAGGCSWKYVVVTVTYLFPCNVCPPWTTMLSSPSMYFSPEENSNNPFEQDPHHIGTSV